MDYKKTSELATTTTLQDTDLLGVAQDNLSGGFVSKKITYDSIKTNLSADLPSSFGITVDGGGSVITTGSKGFVTIPYDKTILNWYLVAGITGSIVFDIKRNGTSIIGTGNKPTLSSQISANAAVSGWTSVALTAGDILEFNVDSIGIITWVNLIIKIGG